MKLNKIFSKNLNKIIQIIQIVDITTFVSVITKSNFKSKSENTSTICNTQNN